MTFVRVSLTKVYKSLLCDEENKKLEKLLFKYSVIRNESYGYAHTDLLLTDNWNEVLEFVNNYGGKNANK